MKSIGQLFTGLLTALASTLLVLGAAMLSLSENGNNLPAIPTFAFTATPTEMSSPLPEGTVQATATKILATKTLAPTQTSQCQPPAGWSQYIIQAGDTLESLAAQVNLPPADLMSANCLRSQSLPVGSIIYMPVVETPTPTETIPPPLPTAPPTETPVPCGPPVGWVIYTVRAGDNLYRLSLAYGISQSQLQTANCLTDTRLYAGQQLYVPNIRTNTPVFTSTSEPTSTRTKAPATATPKTPVASTSTPTATLTATFTPTPTSTPTPTATPTDTTTPTPTATTAGGAGAGTSGATQP